MASKRQRGTGSWEYVVKKKGLLPKPICLTFYSEEEGDAYCANLESLLAKGIVPDQFRIKAKADPVKTIQKAIDEYRNEVTITDDDHAILKHLGESVGTKDLAKVDYKWAESWVKDLRAEGLSPSTIRKKVGALARCLDWVMRRGDTMLVANPLRMLPKRYATTSAGRKDVERDRRLKDGEEKAIKDILNKVKPEGRERAFAIPHADALRLMFTLALETAMRMRETYTLTRDQIDIKNRTIHLDKTKNGDSRQVPMSSVAVTAVKDYLETLEGDNLFPFWDGSHDAYKLRVTTIRISQQWARIFDAAKCPDLTYHDLRHESVSRMFERTKMSEVKIAKISGHSSTKMLMRYTHLRGSTLADEMW
jgi:integrase